MFSLCEPEPARPRCISFKLAENMNEKRERVDAEKINRVFDASSQERHSVSLSLQDVAADTLVYSASSTVYTHFFAAPRIFLNLFRGIYHLCRIVAPLSLTHLQRRQCRGEVIM